MRSLGVNTNNQSGGSDVQIIRNIAAAGFDTVMLSYAANDLEQSIAEIKRQGLTISYYHIGGKNPDNLWARGNAVEEYLSRVIDQIRFCGQNQIPVAVFHAAVGSPLTRVISPSKQGIKNLWVLLNEAKRNGVKLAVENIDCYSLKHVCYLLDHVKDESFGFCYDVGHHHLYNAKKDLVKRYGKRLFAVHLHDNLMDYQKGYDQTRDLHLLPFDGKIDFDQVCRKLNKIGYQGAVMLEIHKIACGNPQLYHCVDDLEYLKDACTRAKKLMKKIKNSD